ncbi:MAG: ATP synthase F1 subunit delta [Planctomycetales bacterium]|nr:ATP synthase F1 subunit delta [Planctomycetales bacterium]
MKPSTVASPYAEALVSLAGDSLAALRDDVEGLLASLAAAPEGLRVLESPGVARAEKRRLLERTLRGRVRDEIVNLLGVAIAHQRDLNLREILRETLRQADEALGRVEARVRVAAPLAADAESRVRGALEKATGRTVTLSVEVKPAVLGGMRVRVKDRVVDATVRTRLREMARRVLAARLTPAVFREGGNP